MPFSSRIAVAIAGSKRIDAGGGGTAIFAGVFGFLAPFVRHMVSPTVGMTVAIAGGQRIDAGCRVAAIFTKIFTGIGIPFVRHMVSSAVGMTIAVA